MRTAQPPSFTAAALADAPHSATLETVAIAIALIPFAPVFADAGASGVTRSRRAADRICYRDVRGCPARAAEVSFRNRPGRCKVYAGQTAKMQAGPWRNSRRGGYCLASPALSPQLISDDLYRSLA